MKGDVQTGLVTGGYAGLPRQPVLAAGWLFGADKRVWANGLANRGATLDTLRMMLATADIRGVK